MVESTARIDGDSSSFNPILVMQLKAALPVGLVLSIGSTVWGGATLLQEIAAGGGIAGAMLAGGLIQRVTVFQPCARVSYIADSRGLTVMSGGLIDHQYPVADIADFRMTRAGKLTSAAFSKWPDLPRAELELHGKRWGKHKDLPRIMVWDNALVETAEREIRSVLRLPPLSVSDA